MAKIFRQSLYSTLSHPGRWWLWTTYLLPYSPDYNPIEQAFPRVKGLLRKAETHTRESLIEAIGGRSRRSWPNTPEAILGIAATMGWSNPYDKRSRTHLAVATEI